MLAATSVLAQDGVQLRERSAVPAHSLAHALRAHRLAPGGMRALPLVPMANATACLRNPSPQKGFRGVVEPGCSPPDYLMEFGNCRRVEALGKGGVAEPGW